MEKYEQSKLLTLDGQEVDATQPIASGTVLKNAFGTTFVVAKAEDSKPKQQTQGLSPCQASHECGPLFV